ncbi:MAG: hypothetical protein ACE5GX_10305 [Thermoanaerobaculia bacterium]
MFLLAQALQDFNWASHAIRFVGFLGFAVVIVIAVVESVSWVRERIANRLAGVRDPEVDPHGFQVRDPESELRHRYYSDPPKVSREQRANEPAKRLERSPGE